MQHEIIKYCIAPDLMLHAPTRCLVNGSFWHYR